MTWQPIETAPKDGRIVLLFVPKAVYPLFVSGRNQTGTQWWVTGMGRVSPTHWMPLPEPPS